MFFIAGVLYVLPGGAFAALLATDVLQALVIGAGWTSFLGALGLRKDYSERKAAKDNVIEQFTTTIKQTADPLDHAELLQEARVAKAL